MDDILKLIVQGVGVFAVTFVLVFWMLDGGPLPFIQIKAESMKPDPRLPTFQPVETRLGDPEYLQEDEPETLPEGDEDARRNSYRMALEEALEGVEADHCDMRQKKLLAVAVTAYIKARQEDIACRFCFWGKSEEEVNRDWSTPLDEKLKERLHEIMVHGHLTREDFKEPPVLFGLRSRGSLLDSC